MTDLITLLGTIWFLKVIITISILIVSGVIIVPAAIQYHVRERRQRRA